MESARLKLDAQRVSAASRVRSRLGAMLVGAFAVVCALPANSDVPIDQAPLYVGKQVPGNLALVPSVEFPTVINQANLGGYDSGRAYMGYFDSAKCYEYAYSDAESERHFYPVRAASSHQCSAADQEWSGNYLNWAATQTIDPFRLALTGGYRVKDTPTETWLEKARHDRNSMYANRGLSSGVSLATPATWSSLWIRIQGLGNKMYIAPANADLSSATVTPYNPARHALTTTGSGRRNDPVVSVVMDTETQRPLSTPLLEVSVRVKVCDSTVGVESNCKQYSQGWKPEGLIQEYSTRLRYSIFGYLNDSSWNRDGGVLRARQKFVGPQTNYPDQDPATNANAEWNSVTGVLYDNPDPNDANATGFGVSHSGVINYLNRFGQMTDAQHKSLDPVSELYYTAVRYFKHLANVPEYSSAANYEQADGFPVITDWDDPIRYYCQANTVLGIGDVYTHRDKNLPGSTPTDGEPAKPATVSADDTVDVVAATRKVFELEGLTTPLNNPFTGRQNSAYIAGLAYDSHTRDIRPDDADVPQTEGKQTLSTYWVDVRENQVLEPKSANQYWLAAKYGGFRVPTDFGDPYQRTAALDLTWWHDTADYLVSGANGGTTKTATNYPRPDNFYVAGEADKMVQGLRQAFEDILEEMIGSSGSFAANTTRLDTDAMAYQAQFYSQTWRGDLVGYSVAQGTGALTEAWSAASKLNARPWQTAPTTGTPRAIKYANSAGALSVFTGDLSTYGAGLNANVVDYLRGDRSREGTGTGQLRPRQGVLGDIVNSQPVYVGAPALYLYNGYSFTGADTYQAFATARASRRPVVYVGANDGMLHGFDARSTINTDPALGGGAETFAFVPNGVLSKLARYTRQDYGTSINPHQYYVDGDLTVADAYIGGSWRTILVGTLGRGGKGVFALDVTDPANVTLLWEKDESDIPELGNVLGKPIITQVADGDWRVILGNGPNSSSGSAQLLMIRLTSGVATTVNMGGTDNGLSGVNVWRSGATDFADTIYAGDLAGNMWRITDLASGPVATRLFQTASGQPITAAPTVSKDPNTGNTWVFFGTGRYLSRGDLGDQTTQSWYGVIDPAAMVTPNPDAMPLGREDLEAVEVLGETDLGNGFRARFIAENASLAADKFGWYIDLPSTGERMVVPNIFQGLTLIGTSRIPDVSDVCSPSGRGFIMAINPFTGGRLSGSFYDINGDGEVDAQDMVGAPGSESPVSGLGLPSGPNNPIFIGSVMLTNMDNAQHHSIQTKAAVMSVRRVNWREVLQD